MAESEEHLTRIANLEADGFVKDWFESWRAALLKSHPSAEQAGDMLPLREMVLEIMSDASPEQCLNPLAAYHLRRFGQKYFVENDLWFWVRSEWEKVDLCYGLAPKRGFDGDWNRAWERGDTGDLGQIEVKVFYAHEPLSKRTEKVNVLLSELEHRARKRDKTRNQRRQRFHALVWLLEHGGCSHMAGVASEIVKATERTQLQVRSSFAGTTAESNLGKLWPAWGGAEYKCGLDLALFELVV